jgi:hypothetical protein
VSPEFSGLISQIGDNPAVGGVLGAFADFVDYLAGGGMEEQESEEGEWPLVSKEKAEALERAYRESWDIPVSSAPAGWDNAGGEGYIRLCAGSGVLYSWDYLYKCDESTWEITKQLPEMNLDWNFVMTGDDISAPLAPIPATVRVRRSVRINAGKSRESSSKCPGDQVGRVINVTIVIEAVQEAGIYASYYYGDRERPEPEVLKAVNVERKLTCCCDPKTGKRVR